MLRGFFGNLIFAIIAQLLCGNHLKRNEWSHLPLNKALSFLSKYHNVMAYLEKMGLKHQYCHPHHIHTYTHTTKQLNCLTPCRVCTRKTDACERRFITKSRIHPQNQSYESALSVVSKRITYTLLLFCEQLITRETSGLFLPTTIVTPQVDSIMANILFHFDSSKSNNTSSQIMAPFQCIFLTSKSSTLITAVYPATAGMISFQQEFQRNGLPLVANYQKHCLT